MSSDSNFTNMTSNVWHKIWHWQGSQQVCTFLWLTTKNSLLTNSERQRRHLAEHGSYQCCQGEDKTITYALRNCPESRAIWILVLPQHIRHSFFTQPLLDWLLSNITSELWQQHNIPSSLFFGLMTWKLWAFRNSTVFEVQERVRPSKVMIKSLAINFLKAMLNLENVIHPGLLQRQNNQSWKVPPVGNFKLNVDAFINLQNRTSAASGLVRDSTGLCLGAFNLKLNFCSPIIIEIWAINYSVKWLLSLGLQNLLVESDSFLAIDRIRNPSRWSGVQKILIEETHILLQRNPGLVIFHIFCEANASANWLARNGTGQPLGFLEFQFFPYALLSILYQDSIGANAFDVFSSQVSNNIQHPPFIAESNLAGLSNGDATRMRV